jgi:alpha-tubulin suppressor-like RCC1 family protein
MKTMKRKILSWVLTLALTVGLLPMMVIPAVAADWGDGHSGIRQVTAGNNFSLAIKNDGTLWEHKPH